MCRLRERIERVAATDFTVLIEGCIDRMQGSRIRGRRSPPAERLVPTARRKGRGASCTGDTLNDSPSRRKCVLTTSWVVLEELCGVAQLPLNP